DTKVAPLTKEEVGRATWMLLHTIAAQFPDEPTRQQKRDAKELVSRTGNSPTFLYIWG
uniref:Sulfhydryl oxidase n=1 Tax=Aegilops tauschii subsp. strangulata TaxID=200361 RepID=A0A453IQK1_AEGTS